jgi:hypothetical protein
LLVAALPVFATTLSGCGTPGVAADGGQNAATSNNAAKPATGVESAPQPVTPEVAEPEMEAAKKVEPVTTNQAQSEAAGQAEPRHVAAEPPKVAAAPRPAGRIVEKTFDDVKFEMSPDEPFRRELIGEKIEGLVGQRIRIRGYILPTSQSRGIKQFVLVRDNQQCCFGPGAALYDCILVSMRPGRTADFSIRPVAVEGTFNIDILPGDDGKPLAIYQLEGDTVK